MDLVSFITALKLSSGDASPFCLHHRLIIPTAPKMPLVVGGVVDNFREIISFNIHANPGREVCFSSGSQMRKLRYPSNDFRTQAVKPPWLRLRLSLGRYHGGIPQCSLGTTSGGSVSVPPAHFTGHKCVLSRFSHV